MPKLVVAIVVSEFAGVIGSLATAPAIPHWYSALVKPALIPPSWLFTPVWVALYALMGIAAYLVWMKRGRIALWIFGIQLALNALWSIMFFGFYDIYGALIEIAFLWFAILITIITFAHYSRAAAWLLVPYILWVSFAAYLNFAIWTLN